MSASKPMRICVVGCGAVSELYYAPVLTALQEAGYVEVTTLFDPNRLRAAKLAQSFPAAATPSDFLQVLRQQDQLAIVASPPRFHAQQTIALLQSGVAVLCEKPMATSASEADSMIAASARACVPLGIALFHRFFPVSQAIRDIVRNGRLGAVKRVEVSEGGPFHWPAQSASFFQKSNSRGGVLADVGVHVLDLLIWWFGWPEDVVYVDDAMGGLEANCLIELAFTEGVRGTVRLSWDTQLPNRTIIECERGWIRCEAAAADRLELGFPDAEYSFGGQLVSLGQAGHNSYRTHAAATQANSFTRQVLNVIAAVRGEEPVFIPAAEGASSVRLIEQCYQHRTLMQMPWLSERELGHARALLAKMECSLSDAG